MRIVGPAKLAKALCREGCKHRRAGLPSAASLERDRHPGGRPGRPARIGQVEPRRRAVTNSGSGPIVVHRRARTVRRTRFGAAREQTPVRGVLTHSARPLAGWPPGVRHGIPPRTTRVERAHLVWGCSPSGRASCAVAGRGLGTWYSVSQSAPSRCSKPTGPVERRRACTALGAEGCWARGGAWGGGGPVRRTAARATGAARAPGTSAGASRPEAQRHQLARPRIRATRRRPTPACPMRCGLSGQAGVVCLCRRGLSKPRQHAPVLVRVVVEGLRHRRSEHTEWWLHLARGQPSLFAWCPSVQDRCTASSRSGWQKLRARAATRRLTRSSGTRRPRASSPPAARRSTAWPLARTAYM
jgi:hypothetical protein